MVRSVGEGGFRRWRTVLVVLLVLVFATVQQIQAQTAQQAADATAGKSLFQGTIRFENRGAPCLACHSVAGIGALGGGTLGPDLTGSFEKFGEEGIAAILANPPFPTMQPIFSERPLTVQEQADVSAFLEGVAVTERDPANIGQLTLLGLAGAALVLILMRFIWRRRLTEVRRPMLSRSQEGR